jgi:predicted phosphoribosyltransferase
MNSRFFDRHRAGRLLAERLSRFPWSRAGIVLALPRGGVPIGYEITRVLNWPLDVWLVRKLGVPHQPELAMGAIALPEAQVLNHELIQKLHISEAQIKAVIQAEIQELHRRERVYRQGRPLPDLTGLPVILVDDGLATGATMQAAITAIQTRHPESITVAVPIAAPSSLRQIEDQVDRTVCLVAPESMGSISQWYVHFEPVPDDTVMALLQERSTTQEEPPITHDPEGPAP